MKRKKTVKSIIKYLKRVNLSHITIWFVPVVVALLIPIIVCIYLFGIYSPIDDVVIFRLEHGTSVSATADALAQQGIISSADMFKTFVRFNGGKIQSGDYEFPRRASLWRVAHMMTHGDIAATVIVIPEGLTIRQIKHLLSSHPGLTGDVECHVGDAVVCDLHDGDVFPDTYRVARGTPRLAVLDLAHKKMVSIARMWEKNGRSMPTPLKNWNDVVTLASIVQKETPRESEMPMVASVYLNRLRKNMRLQADPTVVYALTKGLGDMRGRPLLRGHLRINSPYNTYTHYGLPPAPIANVGDAALRAVLKPADTNYLFFVADGNGGHNFAKSYEEHKRNHANWRQIKQIRNNK